MCAEQSFKSVEMTEAEMPVADRLRLGAFEHSAHRPPVVLPLQLARVRPAYGVCDQALIEISGQAQQVRAGRQACPELRRALADELRGVLRQREGFAVGASAV